MATYFIVKKSVPDEDTWYPVFTNSYWDENAGDGTFDNYPPGEWNSELTGPMFNLLYLPEIGNWVEGFRPTKIRVTLDGGGTVNSLHLEDVDSNTFASSSPYNSGDIVELDFDTFGLDIALLALQDPFSSFTVTNIEFNADPGPSAPE